MSYYNLIVFLAVISTGYPKIIPFDYCDSVDQQRCHVNHLDLQPCEPTGNDTTCIIQRGSTVNTHLSYTPQFNAETLRSQLSYFKNMRQIQFASIENACTNTQCPLQSGQTYNYTITQDVPKHGSTENYLVIHEIWNDSNETCCIKFWLNIIQPKH